MNYTIENKGGVNLLHIGDTMRPATDAEVDLVAQLSQVKSTNYVKLYGMLCEALDHNGMYAQLQPSGDWFELVRKGEHAGRGPKPSVQIINGDVVGTVSDEQIQVVLLDALHRVAERNGYPEWAWVSTSDVFEAYKTWPEDLRARLSVNDLRRMSGWKPKSKEDQVTDALEESGVIDAHQAMERRVAALSTPQSTGEKLSRLMTKDVAEGRIEVPVEAWRHPDSLRLDWIIQKATDSYTGFTLDVSPRYGTRVMWHHHAMGFNRVDPRQAIDQEMGNGN